jgi:hypothetical protein
MKLALQIAAGILIAALAWTALEFGTLGALVHALTAATNEATKPTITAERQAVREAAIEAEARRHEQMEAAQRAAARAAGERDARCHIVTATGRVITCDSEAAHERISAARP